MPKCLCNIDQILTPVMMGSHDFESYLFKLLISKCSIMRRAPLLSRSTTFTGLGTFTVFVHRIASKLAISPSNILLAYREREREIRKKVNDLYFQIVTDRLKLLLSTDNVYKYMI